MPIDLIEPAQAPLLAKPYFSATGETSPVVRALSQVPELVPATMPFIAAALAPGTVDLRTKEIVILRISHLNGCRYCIGAHTVAAADSGLDAAEIAALRDTGNVSWGRRDAAVLALADALARDADGAPAAIEGAIVAGFEQHEIVELVVCAGATVMLNRLCTALELPLTAATAAQLEAIERR